MNTREALLREIDASRRQDKALLMQYADLLEEENTNPADEATVEWIRLCCSPQNLNKKGNLKGTAGASPWLKANWKRLVPTAWAANVEYKAPTGSLFGPAMLDDLLGDRPGVQVPLPNASPQDFETIKNAPDGEIIDRGAVELLMGGVRGDRWSNTRTLRAYWLLYPDSLADFVRPRQYQAFLEFDQAGVKSFRMWIRHGADTLNPLIIEDQPLASVYRELWECPRCELFMVDHQDDRGGGRCGQLVRVKGGDYETIGRVITLSCPRCMVNFDRVRENVFEPRQATVEFHSATASGTSRGHAL